MPTRRKRTKRKSRKGGEYGIREGKTWADNYKNCMKQLKDDPDGTVGGKTADMKCMGTMITTDYHGRGDNSPWDDDRKFSVPRMWRHGDVVNHEFKKSEFERGDVKNPDRRDYLQQFEKKGFIKAVLGSPSWPADNPAELEHNRKLAKYPKPVGV